MTARRPNHSESDNSTDHDPDAQTLLDYLHETGPTSIERLATQAGLRRSEIKDLVRHLDQRDDVDVSRGLQTVTVTPTTDDDRVRADGGDTTSDGPLHRLVDYVTADAPTLDLDEATFYRIVASRRRRSLIRLVAAACDGPDAVDGAYVELADAATAIARTETQDEPEQEDFHRVYVALCQTHAPLLDDTGILEYYDRVQKVGATTDTVLLERVLAQNQLLVTGASKP